MFIAAQDRASRGWDKQEPTPINRLKLCDALWARYTVEEGADTAERMEWLRGVVAMHLRDAPAKDVLDNPHDEAHIAAVRAKVHALTSRFPVYG